jgi:hypothetical protein
VRRRTGTFADARPEKIVPVRSAEPQRMASAKRALPVRPRSAI